MSKPSTTVCPECGRDRGNREPHRPGCSGCKPETTEFWRLPKSQQTFIEEVARAICKADGCDPDRPTHPRQVYRDDPILAVAIPEWRNFIPHAQAAIETINND